MRRVLLVLCLLALVACGSGAPLPILKDQLSEGPDGAAEVQIPEEDVEAVEVLSNPAQVVLDGRFDDWPEDHPAMADPIGDAGPSGIDLLGLGLADDGRRLFLDLEIGAARCLNFGHAVSLRLRCVAATDGRELWWSPGWRAGRLTDGVQEMDLEQAELGFLAAPAFTASRFEMALDLDALEIHLGECAREALEVRIEDRAGTGGDTIPDRGMLEYRLSDVAPEIPEPPAFQRVPGTLRVLTWNVLWSGIVDPALTPSYRRVIQALNPDVIALQEILEHGEVHELLLDWFPGEWWEYSGWGNVVTLSRFPRQWDWPGTYQPLDSRINVSAFDVPDAGMMVLFNAHLSFGDQDEARQYEADSFVAYVRDLKTPGGLVDMPEGTPFALVGDMNLVGEADQLETLLTGAIHDTATFGSPEAPDWDDTPLEDRFPMHATQRVTHTWRSEGSYWPSKLDYLILPDSVVSVANEFVLDTGALSDGVLEQLSLERDDTSVSDHLPVIVDLVLPGG